MVSRYKQIPSAINKTCFPDFAKKATILALAYQLCLLHCTVTILVQFSFGLMVINSELP